MEGVSSVLLLASEANLVDKRCQEEDQACQSVSTKTVPHTYHYIISGRS